MAAAGYRKNLNQTRCGTGENSQLPLYLLVVAAQQLRLVQCVRNILK